MKKKWNFNNISKSRNLLLGLATIWVAIFHSNFLDFRPIIKSNFIGNILMCYKNIGALGVDIFLILSGIGLYYSFSKNSKIIEFYKKRFIRIIPISLIVVGLYAAFIPANVTAKIYLQKILLLDFFITGNVNFWYLSVILVLYLIYPLLHKLINKYDKWAVTVLITIILIINACVMTFLSNFYELYEIALTRLPAFIVGIYLGKITYKKKSITWWYMLIPIAFLLISFAILYNNPMNGSLFHARRYISFIIALSFVLSVSFINTFINLKYLSRLISWIGNYSLEIYIIYAHLGIKYVTSIKISDATYITNYFVIFIITILLSFVIRGVSDDFVKNIFITMDQKKDIKAIKNNSF